MDAPDLAIEGLWLETFPAPGCVPQRHVGLGLGRSAPQRRARRRGRQHRRGPGLYTVLTGKLKTKNFELRGPCGRIRIQITTEV